MTDAASLTRSLAGKWYGSYGVAACPVCQTERRRDQRALTLADGATGLLLHCKRGGCGFRDILAGAGVSPGRWQRPDPVITAQRKAEERAVAEKRAAQAMQLWSETSPLPGTVAEAYLRGRAITCPLPETLRFHPACWHVSAQRLPALVALVQGGDGCAVLRTYLRADGCGKADVDPQRAMLGAVAGGAVRLREGSGRLVVAEGVETALSLACGPLDGPAAIWAALSTSGLRGLRLPPRPGWLTIAPDNDAAGQGAAAALAERAHALGWQVGLLEPPAGRDWNDVMQGKAVMA